MKMKNYAGTIKIINTNFVRKGAAANTQEDVKTVLERMLKILEKVKSSGVLAGLLDDVKLMFSMLKDYGNGSYREVPVGTIGAVTFALLYVFWPFDLIPDAIPFFGQLDDAAVVTICLRLVKRDLERYRQWKQNQSGNSQPDLIN
jgi:uncharacterized membrane protein YkvA (DUF1232 family)